MCLLCAYWVTVLIVRLRYLIFKYLDALYQTEDCREVLNESHRHKGPRNAESSLLPEGLCHSKGLQHSTLGGYCRQPTFCQSSLNPGRGSNWDPVSHFSAHGSKGFPPHWQFPLQFCGCIKAPSCSTRAQSALTICFLSSPQHPAPNAS